MADINLTTAEISTRVRESLTSSEAANLWNQYMGDSSAICIYSYLFQITADREIQSILEHALQLSKQHLEKITEFFSQANYPIPKGFTLENDVNLNAPRLFSDPFIIYYSEIMAIHGLTTYSLAVSSSERDDIRNYYNECIATASELLNKVIRLSKSKGQYAESPMIPSPDHIDFVEKKGILSDLFGDPKPLTVTEITSLFFNLKKTILAKSSTLAFCQVAESKEVRNLFTQGAELEENHVRDLSELMYKDNLPVPRTWDSDITDSTISPFSDKLMMFHIGFKLSASIAYYSSGMGTSRRADIVTTYSKIIMEVLKLSNDWLSLMVKNQWLEKQPEAVNRKSLTQR